MHQVKRKLIDFILTAIKMMIFCYKIWLFIEKLRKIQN